MRVKEKMEEGRMEGDGRDRSRNEENAEDREDRNNRERARVTGRVARRRRMASMPENQG